jgi:hypothetical protein
MHHLNKIRRVRHTRGWSSILQHLLKNEGVVYLILRIVTNTAKLPPVIIPQRGALL